MEDILLLQDRTKKGILVGFLDVDSFSEVSELTELDELERSVILVAWARTFLILPLNRRMNISNTSSLREDDALSDTSELTDLDTLERYVPFLKYMPSRPAHWIYIQNHGYYRLGAAGYVPPITKETYMERDDN